MLTNWTAAGQCPSLFWDQTFATFNAVMLGSAKRRSDDYAHAIAGAWWGEFFAREKKVKGLQDYLPKPPLSEAELNMEREAGSRRLLSMLRRMSDRQVAAGKTPMKIRKVKRHGAAAR